MLIHHQCERNKGSQAALAQVSRPSVGHELPSVSLNTDADVLFEHISGRNPIVGDALIFQDIQVDSQSNCTQTFFSTAAADSPALVISPARKPLSPHTRPASDGLRRISGAPYLFGLIRDL